MDKRLEQIAKDALQEAKEQGMGDEDAKWMAVGAVNAEARKRGIIDEELSPEMNAASQVIVKSVQGHG